MNCSIRQRPRRWVRIPHLVIMTMTLVLPASLGVASASGDSYAYLVTGSQAKANCKVYTETSKDNFKTVQNTSTTTACEGGIVWVERTTLAAARSAVGAGDNNSGLIQTIVESTGNSDLDRVAVATAADDIHEEFLGLEGSANGSAAAMTANDSVDPEGGCLEGSVRQSKRQIIYFDVKKASTQVKVRVYYSRIACNMWHMDSVDSRLMDDPSRTVRAEEFQYTLTRWSQNDFRLGTYDVGCKTMSSRGWVESQPDFYIQTKGRFQYKVEQDSDYYYDPYCLYGGGIAATSLWTRLPGPMN